MASSLRRIFILLLLLLRASLPAGSSAQQPSAQQSSPQAPASLQLTLKQAVQLALKQNPQRVIARLLSFESDRNRDIALSALLPQAHIEGQGSINQYNFQSIERAPKRSAAGPFQVIQAGPAFSQTISTSRCFADTRSAGKARARRARTNRPRARPWSTWWWINTC